MKKVIILLALLISTACYAGDNSIQLLTNPVKVQQYATAQILCIDGYKYLVTAIKPPGEDYRSGMGVSVTQMMQITSTSNLPRPVRCKE